MKYLDAYDMSRERGFLCRFNANEIEFPDALIPARDVAKRLPQLLPSGRVRSLLVRDLPDLDMEEVLTTCDDATIRLAMVHYSFMVQAYVWGEEQPPEVLPRCLAQPIVALADQLGQQPLLPYSSYVLDNWGLLDRDGPIDLSNIFMLQHFLGGQDEAWFVLIHVAIEAEAGKILAMMEPAIAAAKAEDIEQVRTSLEEIAGVWERLNQIFDRMPERCDPYIYFERVRPYIHGWKDNPALPDGIIYEGVERYGTKGQAFRGQTGSQSSIVPAMDALLGVGHAMDPMKRFLDQLHMYRPPAHRAFIEDVRAASTLRDLVKRVANKSLTESYNANIQAVASFRSRHLEYAASYINKQSARQSGNDTDVGTGGTPFMKYLKKHRDETRERLLPA